MSSFVLKIIAILSMTIDHLGDAWFHYATWMNVVGRIAFPIFAFQITEGYTHTKNLKKYFLRLFLFALISQIPFMLFESLYVEDYTLNIFFTLLAGLFAIFVYDKLVNTSFSFGNSSTFTICLKHFCGIFFAILLGILAELLRFDYGFFGVSVIFLFYAFKNHKPFMVLSFILICILKYGITILANGYHYFYILFCLFAILPIVFICLYNRKQGKKVKYLLYFFYPAHLLALYLIFGLLVK